MGPMNNNPGGMPPPMPPMGANNQNPPEGDDDILNKLQEIIETVVSDKVSEPLKKIDELSEWKEDVESRYSELETKFKLLREDFNNLSSSILGKVNDYDKNIVSIGTDLKAMERVFQKVLPVFTENVNELGRISQDLKEVRGNKL